MDTVIKKRRLALAAGLVTYICVGFIYSWSNFVAPMDSQSGWSRSETSVAFTLSMLTFGICCFLGGMLVKRLDTATVVRIGSLLMLLGIWGTSLTYDVHFMWFLYGIVASAGYGVTYTANMSAVQAWFPDKTGFISGLLLAAYGLGGMITGTIAMIIVNASGWRAAFKVMGIGIGFLTLTAARFIIPPDEEQNILLRSLIETDSCDESRKISASCLNPGEQSLDVDLKGMFRRKSWWLYFAWACMASVLWQGTVGQTASFALDMGASVGLATTATGCITVGNGLGRLLFGTLYDRMKRSKVMNLISGLLLLTTAMMFVALAGGHLGLLIAASLLMGLGYGGQASTNPIFIRRFFGDSNYAENFGIVNFNSIFGSVFGVTVGSVLITCFEGYFVMMTYFTIVAALAFIAQSFIRRP